MGSAWGPSRRSGRRARCEHATGVKDLATGDAGLVIVATATGRSGTRTLVALVPGGRSDDGGGDTTPPTLTDVFPGGTRQATVAP
jgi:hypothetical protein